MTLKVAAYITLYKDKQAASNCLQAIQSQSIPIDIVFVVDNSEQKLLEIDNNGSILIHHYPENIGIGKGFALGLEWAIKEGYDFLWAFDQDSLPTNHCLEILLKIYNNLSLNDDNKIGIIAPTAIDCKTKEIVQGAVFVKDQFKGCKHHNNVDFYECDSPITSGSLISIAAAKTVGLPRAELFIDGIDLDYGLRLRQQGFRNLIVTNAIMYHNFGNPVKVKFFQREIIVHKYSSLRNYYINRNHTYLETRNAKGLYRLRSYGQRIKYLFRRIVTILLYDPEEKTLKIWACLLGTFHGFQGKLGKTWF
ncbi:MAG: glycosyltransferase family 2 protein [Nostoc sp. DedVER02]|uniref:glycosyltransferase family 2 protein n=1 Tax=unclassified Nostoc TaxID=2593658 RepID=UPI002AD3FD28|nr:MULTISPECIES: glycosyltransferase family 2 protein [unclassified Nostoc]MDZ7984971.1 glycosyltransferase family 2 protein [Nostoc sp. DedVER02]MDZ8114141.1 glycosyltransferase family 2 protein [Nostoc sp. DedVER01b]